MSINTGSIGYNYPQATKIQPKPNHQNGNLRKTELGPDNTVFVTRTNALTNKVVTTSHYNEDGSWIEARCDADGNLSIATGYRKDGSKEYTAKYIPGTGRISEIIDYDKDGNLITATPKKSGRGCYGRDLNGLRNVYA